MTTIKKFLSDELTDTDFEEIARLVANGNKGGILDREENQKYNEAAIRITWELKLSVIRL